MRPWMAWRCMSGSRRRRCFNGATALRPWMGCNRWRTHRTTSRFNGATALPWMAGYRRRHRRRAQASMGPRPCGRGWFVGAGNALIGPACFNGATALRPWMAELISRSRLSQLMLQWGHGLAAVDGTPCAPPPRKRIGFNGATALRPWMVTHGRPDSTPSPASMGPRPCGRGWQLSRPCRRPVFLASMGPRPCGRGWRRGRRGKREALPASMGPRPCGRGWNDSGFYACAANLLQWGHGLAAVDGRRDRGRPCRARASMGPRPCGRGWDHNEHNRSGCDQLQWGHGLAAVDGLPTTARPPRLQSFNGATALRPWMAPLPAGGGGGSGGFNGATALRPWMDRSD